MKKLPIGIFGGTFDPLHLGHIHLLKAIYGAGYIQKIVLIPCHQSPFKNKPIASGEDRINMALLAAKDLPYIEIDDYEIKQPAVSYTIQTLEHLRNKFKEDAFMLIIGSDAFNEFDQWHKWQEILKFTHILVISRPKMDSITNKNVLELLSKRQAHKTEELQNKKAGLIYVADLKMLDISATEIRNLTHENHDASRLVIKEVWQYIINHKLYMKKI
jgi:nicotinate-nucleotide adenylyltransferase